MGGFTSTRWTTGLQIAKARAGALLAARGARMPLMASPGAGGEGVQRRHKARVSRSRGGPSEGGAVTPSAGGGCMHMLMAVALHTEEL